MSNWVDCEGVVNVHQCQFQPIALDHVFDPGPILAKFLQALDEVHQSRQNQFLRQFRLQVPSASAEIYNYPTLNFARLLLLYHHAQAADGTTPPNFFSFTTGDTLEVFLLLIAGQLDLGPFFVFLNTLVVLQVRRSQRQVIILFQTWVAFLLFCQGENATHFNLFLNAQRDPFLQPTCHKSFSISRQASSNL